MSSGTWLEARVANTAGVLLIGFRPQLAHQMSPNAPNAYEIRVVPTLRNQAPTPLCAAVQLVHQHASMGGRREARQRGVNGRV